MSGTNSFTVLKAFVTISITSVFRDIKAFDVLPKRGLIEGEKLEEILKRPTIIPGSRLLILSLELGDVLAGFQGSIAALLGLIIPTITLAPLIYFLFHLIYTVNFVLLLILAFQPLTLAIISVEVNKFRMKSIKTPGDYISMVLYFGLYFTGFPVIFIILGAGLLSVSNFYYQRSKPVEFLHKFEDEKIEDSFAADTKPTRRELVVLTLWLGITVLLFTTSNVNSTVGFTKIVYLTSSVQYLDGYLSIAAFLDELGSSLGVVNQFNFLALLSLAFLLPTPTVAFVILIGALLGGYLLSPLLLLTYLLPTVLLFYSTRTMSMRLRRSRLYGDFLKGVHNSSIAVLYGSIMVLAFDIIQFWPSLFLFPLAVVVYHYLRPPKFITITLGGIFGVILFVIF